VRRSLNVRHYVCGPTVLRLRPISHARPFIVFDVLVPAAAACLGAAHVTYVRNITELDDKIMIAPHWISPQRA